MPIIAKTDLESFPLRFGTVVFQLGFGLEELQEAWPGLKKEIRDVQ